MLLAQDTVEVKGVLFFNPEKFSPFVFVALVFLVVFIMIKREAGLPSSIRKITGLEAC